MPLSDRSISDILYDSFRNLQDIVRAEVRLAKTEIREEAGKAKSSVVWLSAGGVAALFSILFLLAATVAALALVMPLWAASLSVGSALAGIAALTLWAGVKRFKQIHPAPERTVETMKENVEWIRQQVR